MGFGPQCNGRPLGVQTGTVKLRLEIDTLSILHQHTIHGFLESPPGQQLGITG